jgi:hypothetical protein
MKHQLSTVTNRKKKAMSVPFFNYLKGARVTQPLLTILAAAFLCTSCTKRDLHQPKNETQSVSSDESNALAGCINWQNKTVQELLQARRATEKYKDINNAFADGYVDIDVVMDSMGYHFQRVDITDSIFDIEHPELLVYNKMEDGTFKLVAVEYAVPLDQSADSPRGFTGHQDVWDHNDAFGLWLLHAWVWDYNPLGVFNPTNPRVHVKM